MVAFHTLAEHRLSSLLLLTHDAAGFFIGGEPRK